MLAEVSLQDPVVVTLEADDVARPEGRERVVAPVPAQLAVDVGVVGEPAPQRVVLAMVGDQRPDRVARRAQALVDPAVDELVPAQVVRRVEARDPEDPQRAQPKTRSRTSSSTSKFAWTSETSSLSSSASMSFASFSAPSSSNGVRTWGRKTSSARS